MLLSPMAIAVTTSGLPEPCFTPPEYLDQESSCVDHLLRGLEARGISYRERVEVLD